MTTTKSHRFYCEGGDVDKSIPNGVSWSPDGTCLLTSVDDRLHLFELEGSLEKATLSCRDGERVNDYAWFPGMHSSNPRSCCFASCSRDHPVHLWDAYDGSLRASYVARGLADDVRSAVSLAFSPDGAWLYAGMNRSIRVFATAEPGVESDDLLKETTKKSCELRGLVGALDVFGHHLVAAGSYSRTAAVYDTRTSSPQALLNEKGMGGVTAVKFAGDDELWTGSRKDDQLRRWDLRTQRVLTRLERPCATNQKISFHVDDAVVVAGSDAGLRVFDRQAQTKKIVGSPRLPINGCSTHPFLPLIATSSGQRSYSNDPLVLNDPSNFSVQVFDSVSLFSDDSDEESSSSAKSSVAY